MHRDTLSSNSEQGCCFFNLPDEVRFITQHHFILLLDSPKTKLAISLFEMNVEMKIVSKI
jgi:hypothetical protein